MLMQPNLPDRRHPEHPFGKRNQGDVAQLCSIADQMRDFSVWRGHLSLPDGPHNRRGCGSSDTSDRLKRRETTYDPI